MNQFKIANIDAFVQSLRKGNDWELTFWEDRNVLNIDWGWQTIRLDVRPRNSLTPIRVHDGVATDIDLGCALNPMGLADMVESEEFQSLLTKGLDAFQVKPNPIRYHGDGGFDPAKGFHPDMIRELLDPHLELGGKLWSPYTHGLPEEFFEDSIEEIREWVSGLDDDEIESWTNSYYADALSCNVILDFDGLRDFLKELSRKTGPARVYVVLTDSRDSDFKTEAKIRFLEREAKEAAINLGNRALSFYDLKPLARDWTNVGLSEVVRCFNEAIDISEDSYGTHIRVITEEVPS